MEIETRILNSKTKFESENWNSNSKIEFETGNRVRIRVSIWNFGYEFRLRVSSFDFRISISCFDFEFLVSSIHFEPWFPVSILKSSFDLELRFPDSPPSLVLIYWPFGPVWSYCTGPSCKFDPYVLALRASLVLMYWPFGFSPSPFPTLVGSLSPVNPYFFTRGRSWSLDLRTPI